MTKPMKGWSDKEKTEDKANSQRGSGKELTIEESKSDIEKLYHENESDTEASVYIDIKTNRWSEGKNMKQGKRKKRENEVKWMW